MAIRTISSKNQIQLPPEARKVLGAKAGDKVLIVVRGKYLPIIKRPTCKPLVDKYDFEALRKSVLIPTGVEDTSLRTDGPFAYRDMDSCLGLIDEYVEVIARFGVIGYMAHL